MNNTKTLTAIAAILIAATLVVGGTLAATSAFAYQQKKGGSQENSKNGNTVTIEECKNRGSASGFDTNVNQECENLICTHPGDGATCVSEPGQATPPATGTLLVKKVVKCIDTIIVDGCQNKKFNIKVTDTNPDPSSFDLGNGGTQLVTLGAGTYTVSEPEHTGFNVEFSGDCNANGDGTIAAGAHQTCTITNTEHTCLRLC
jgi:Family of unknown function (DUF6346)